MRKRASSDQNERGAASAQGLLARKGGWLRKLVDYRTTTKKGNVCYEI